MADKKDKPKVSVSGRARVRGTTRTVTVELPAEMDAALDKYAAATLLTRRAIIMTALKTLLGKKKFLKAEKSLEWTSK